MARLTLARALLALGFVARPLVGQGRSAPDPISDNSFLIEEAYNQEAGVVQHISTFTRPGGGGSWAYSFTQEWPYRGMRHQLSYSLPVVHDDETGTGVGDVALNYRYQLRGSGGPELNVAPRLSLLLPTGSERHGRGAGGLGIQANIPLSLRPSPRVALHANAGLTLTPSARNAIGDGATTLGANLGASAVWLLLPRLNALVELVYLSTEAVAGPSTGIRSNSLLLNPGIRGAMDFASGLQIVPGAAYTLSLDGEGGDGLFLYLSFEHPFRK